MAKKTLSKDFGIFGDLSEETKPDAPAAEGEQATPPTDIPDDIFGINSDEPVKEETPTPEEEEIPTPEEGDETPPEGDGTTIEDENEILRLIREAEASINELEESPDLTPEDKKKVQELSDTVDELTARNESLSRQLEAAREASNKTLEDGEGLRIYQPIIDKLEKDPQLMLFVKYMGTKNETMKNRLTDIAKDLLYTLTWVDVYSLMDTQTKGDATALGMESEEAVPPALDTPKEVTGQKYTRKKDPTFPL
jgi:hypothetical protein